MDCQTDRRNTPWGVGRTRDCEHGTSGSCFARYRIYFRRSKKYRIDHVAINQVLRGDRRTIALHENASALIIGRSRRACRHRKRRASINVRLVEFLFSVLELTASSCLALICRCWRSRSTASKRLLANGVILSREYAEMSPIFLLPEIRCARFSLNRKGEATFPPILPQAKEN
jgi:hypothetical protein